MAAKQALQLQLTEAKRDATALKVTNDAMHVELDEALGANKILQGQLDEAEDAKKTLRGKINNAEGAKKDLQGKLDVATGDKDELHGRFGPLQAKLDEALNAMRGLQKLPLSHPVRNQQEIRAQLASVGFGVKL